MPTTTTWNRAVVSLATIPGNYFLGFEVYTTSSTSGIYIDYVFGPQFADIAPGPVTLVNPAPDATGINEFPIFSWNPPITGGIPTSYTILCDQNPIPVTPIGTASGLSYTATEALQFGQPYQWSVVATNGHGSSEGNPVSTFTTRTDPTVSVPWTEDFGTTGAGFPPDNWVRYIGVIADPSDLVQSNSFWVQDDWRNDTTANPKDFAARMNVYSSNRYAWLITPPIMLPAENCQLEFDLALTDYANFAPPDTPVGFSGVDDRFVILVGNGTSWTPANILTQWDNASSASVYNEIPHTGQHITIPLQGYSDRIYIAFYAESSVSNADNDLFVDNVTVRVVPEGLPDHVQLISPPDQSLDLDPEAVEFTWNPALTGGTPEYFEVCLGENPINPAINYYGEHRWITEENSFNPFVQENFDLGYSSLWYWAVLPYNGGGNPQHPDPVSPDFMVWQFVTAPDPTIYVLPHFQNFDLVSTPDIPWGWKKYLQYSTGTPNITTTTSNPVSVPNIVNMTNSTDASATVILVSPPFDMSISTVRTRFYARSSVTGQTLLIGAMDSNRATFEQIGSVNLTTTNTQYSLDLNGYTRDYPYIGFKHGLGATTRSIYIDNVEFLELVDKDLSAVSLHCNGLAYEGSQADYVVTVKNEGQMEQASYTICLKRSDDNQLLAGPIQINQSLASGSTIQHTISWNPSAAFVGPNRLYAEVILADDVIPGNNQSPSQPVYVVGTTTEIIGVGDPDSDLKSATLPINFHYKCGVTETLYFYDETHLISGNIIGIVLKNQFTQDLKQEQVKVWMGQNMLSDLCGGWVLSDGLTPVFDGFVDFPIGTNEVVIPLPVAYTVSDATNLLIRYHRPMDTVYYNESNQFYYTSTLSHPTRSRYIISDSAVVDPLAPSEAGDTSANVPNTLLLVDNAVIGQPAILEGYVRDTNNNPIVEATVTLTERTSTFTDLTGFYRFSFWVADDYNATASKFGYYNVTYSDITTVLGSTVSRDFVLVNQPRVTVSGTILANDAPDGLEGAEISLNGIENYHTTSGAGGLFSIPDVLGHVDGQSYTLIVEKEGYQPHQSIRAVLESDLDVGIITLLEYLYPPYDLVATHSGVDQSDVLLNWTQAGPPNYIFYDFESSDYGWIPSSNWSNPLGDWEWSNTYDVDEFDYIYTGSNVTPPPTAHSGTGMWGTKMFTNYTNAEGYSYLSKTISLEGVFNAQLRFWSWENINGNYDPGCVRVNGDLVWGPSWDYQSTQWRERVIPLTNYDNLPSVEIRFEFYATNVVNYAGWYIDDVYIGPALDKHFGQFSISGIDRVLQNYSIYRMRAADVNNPTTWTTLIDDHELTTYTDENFDELPGDIYKWAVKANYSGGLQSNPVFSNPLVRVYPPDDIVVDHDGNIVLISWAAEPGADFYKVYASHNPHGPFNYLGWTTSTNCSTIASVARKFFVVVACTDEPLPDTPPLD